MDNPEFVYSLDGEWFEEEESIQDVVNDQADPGAKVSGYKGRPIAVTHHDHTKHLRLIELIQELAYDEDDEAAEDYLLDCTIPMEEELCKMIADYLEKNCKTPAYYRIGDIQDHIFTADSDNE